MSISNTSITSMQSVHLPSLGRPLVLATWAFVLLDVALINSQLGTCLLTSLLSTI